MKIRLFHAPFVDESGVERKRLCAFVLGLDEEDGGRQVIDEIKRALAMSETEAAVIGVSADVEVEWL